MRDAVNKIAASQGLSKSKASDALKAEIESLALSDSGYWDGSEGPITSGTWKGPGIPA
jgi:hypothetical protein